MQAWTQDDLQTKKPEALQLIVRTLQYDDGVTKTLLEYVARCINMYRTDVDDFRLLQCVKHQHHLVRDDPSVAFCVMTVMQVFRINEKEVLEAYRKANELEEE